MFRTYAVGLHFTNCQFAVSGCPGRLSHRQSGIPGIADEDAPRSLVLHIGIGQIPAVPTERAFNQRIADEKRIAGETGVALVRRRCILQQLVRKVEVLIRQRHISPAGAGLHHPLEFRQMVLINPARKTAVLYA